VLPQSTDIAVVPQKATFRGKKITRKLFRKPLFFIRLTQFEYWPVWILFFPSFIYGLYLAFRSRSLTYFSAANPAIDLGGFFGESKSGILNKLDSKYLPKSTHFAAASTLQVVSWMQSEFVEYPVICKPDKGERGYNVKKINNDLELNEYLMQNNRDLIIQEFVDYKHELGVLYYRMPDKSSYGVTSIVIKEFMSVTGDGFQTVGELMEKSDRARLQTERFRKENPELMNTIVAADEKMVLEPIGNHCKGTAFLNGNHLINQKLNNVFSKICDPVDGFYFGRLDLKVKSIEDLYQGHNIKILEVNGTTSEPAHIYDPSMTLMDAQRSIFYHTKLVYDIAKQNHKRGIPFTPVSEAVKTVYRHFKSVS